MYKIMIYILLLIIASSHQSIGGGHVVRKPFVELDAVNKHFLLSSDLARSHVSLSQLYVKALVGGVVNVSDFTQGGSQCGS